MQIEISLPTFYSIGDERRFFQALSNLSAITEFHGEGQRLLISISIRSLNKESLIEMISLFRRYSVPLSPLNPLAKNKKFHWLNDARYTWHENMFASSSIQS